jgi:hypothetical protein
MGRWRRWLLPCNSSSAIDAWNSGRYLFLQYNFSFWGLRSFLDLFYFVPNKRWVGWIRQWRRHESDR